MPHRSLAYWFPNYFQGQCDCLGKENSPQPSVALRSAPDKAVLKKDPLELPQGPNVLQLTYPWCVALTSLLLSPRCQYRQFLEVVWREKNISYGDSSEREMFVEQSWNSPIAEKKKKSRQAWYSQLEEMPSILCHPGSWVRKLVPLEGMPFTIFQAFQSKTNIILFGKPVLGSINWYLFSPCSTAPSLNKANFFSNYSALKQRL